MQRRITVRTSRVNARPLRGLVVLSGVVGLLLPRPVAAQEPQLGLAVIGVPEVICCGLLLWLGLLVNVGCLVWVTNDARKRGERAGAWVVMVLLFGPLGLLAYRLSGPQST